MKHLEMEDFNACKFDSYSVYLAVDSGRHMWMMWFIAIKCFARGQVDTGG